MTTKINNAAKLSKSNKKSLTTDERGLTTVEYIIVLVLIAVTGFAIWQKFGKTVKQKVIGSESTINEASTSSNTSE